jgi:hypothetical protein
MYRRICVYECVRVLHVHMYHQIANTAQIGNEFGKKSLSLVQNVGSQSKKPEVKHTISCRAYGNISNKHDVAVAL